VDFLCNSSLLKIVLVLVLLLLLDFAFPFFLSRLARQRIASINIGFAADLLCSSVTKESSISASLLAVFRAGSGEG